MTDLITLSSSVLEDSVRVIGFRGAEAMSRPYEIEIYLTLEAADSEAFDMADAIGAKATLTIDRGDPKVPPFLFAGIFGSVELLQEVGDRTLYRAFLVPRLRQLALSRHSRIFSKQSFPSVLEAVLQDNGFSSDDYELRLGTYDVEEHICQYRESDLDFLARWMEREGIYYFFEHGEHGEKVVFGDGKSYEPDPVGTPVRYHPQSGDDRSAAACFRTFTCRHHNLPATVRLKDYDYAHPNLGVTGMAPVSQNGTGEVSLYGERFFTPAAGERLARLRAEELLARQVLFRADGTRFHFRPGYTFELEDHPRGPFNTKYLAIEVYHHGNQGGQGSAFGRQWAPLHDEVYFVEVLAIPATTQFRPESRTPWPRIYGYENGVVDGPADSEYAQIDEQGRYKVKFFFDESNLKGGGGSTFVRMMQPHGGTVEGFHFPLRKGTEVLLSFLGGDPDRPVISGVAPNALTPSPVTSGNQTLNVIQTGSNNRIQLDDLLGGEQISISTPFESTAIVMGAPYRGYNMTLTTNGKTCFYGGGDWDVTYYGWKHEIILKDVVESYCQSQQTSVELEKMTWVKGLVREDYDAGQVTNVTTGHRKVNVVGGGASEAVNDAFTVHAGGGVTFLVNKPNAAPFSPTAGSDQDGERFVPTEPGFHVNVAENRIFLEAPKSSIDLDALTDITLNSTAGEIRVDAKTGIVKIHAANGIEITSEGKITVDGKADAVNTTMGDTISLTVGNSTSYTQGNSQEMSVGDSTSFSWGNSVSFSGGRSLDMTISAALALNAGIGMEVNSLAITFNTFELGLKVIDLASGNIKAQLEALHLLG